MVSNVVASLLFSLTRIHLVSTTNVKSAQNQITILEKRKKIGKNEADKAIRQRNEHHVDVSSLIYKS